MNVSEQIAALFDAHQRQTLLITGTDKNGTSITITEADVVANGFSIDRCSCSGSKLEIGTAIAAEMTLKLYNTNGRFDNIVFEGTELRVRIGIADWTQRNPTINYIECGYFTPDEQPRNRVIITIRAFDRMVKFDKVVEDNDISFPLTLGALLVRACNKCGLPVGQNYFDQPNVGLIIYSLPTNHSQLTWRKIVQWCVGLMGMNAFINQYGLFYTSWYTDSSYESTPDRRYNSDLQENSITITGVEYTNSQQMKYVAGTDVYALDLSNDALLATLSETDLQTALQNVFLAVNGFTYRPFEAEVNPAPWLWPMDRILFTDLNDNSYLAILTNVNTTINGNTVVKSCGETTQSNSYAALGGLTPDQVKALTGVFQELNEAFQAAIDSATKQITGAENSHFHYVFDSNGNLSEILCMDTTDTRTARKVWRWNNEGFGFSSTGINGPYSLAMTADGAIVATMITSGKLSATMVEGGLLQGVAINIGNGNFTVNSQGQIVANDAELSGTVTTESSDGASNIGTVKLQDGGVEIYEGSETTQDLNFAGGIDAKYGNIRIYPASGKSVTFTNKSNGEIGDEISVDSDGIHINVDTRMKVSDDNYLTEHTCFNGYVRDSNNTLRPVINGLICYS